MDILEQLRALERRKKAKAGSSSLATLVTGRDLERFREERKVAIDQFVPGTIRSNSSGSYFLSTRHFPRDHRQGFQGLPEEYPLNLLRRLAAGEEELAEPAPHLVYLDTETTGLAGGAGTFAFLVGLGYWRREEGAKQFVVEQFFMRDYDEETALLGALDERFREEAFSAVVTYNGRRFDVPLLVSRYIANRQRDRIARLPQIDLLYPVRQLWKLRHGDCSLANIEREVLGVRREGDIPGAEIPKTYFQFVRGGDPRRMIPVFSHNADDILSLAALTGRVLEQLSFTSPEQLDPVESYSLGRIHLRNGSLEQASVFFEPLDPEQLPFQIYLRSQQELALAHKRRGQWEKAVQLWLETVETLETGLPDSEENWGHGLFAFEELAKFFEHRQKEFARAREFVVRALEIADQQHWPEVEAKLRHRLARLERKSGSITESNGEEQH